MTRNQLHDLVDRVPEESLAQVAEFLSEVIIAPGDHIWSDPDYQAYVLARIKLAEEEVARGETVTLQEAKQQFPYLFEK